nr:Uncharacterised protein [Escherichia coli]
MLGDTLKQFSDIYNQLWHDIRSYNGKQNDFNQFLSPEDISILEFLVTNKIFQLKAFEILLHVAPDNALNLLKDAIFPLIFLITLKIMWQILKLCYLI